jgi:hypothetical protein
VRTFITSLSTSASSLLLRASADLNIRIVHAESKRGGGGGGFRGASLLGDDVKEKKDFLKLR